MKKVLIVVPAAHTWFWLQSCMTTLLRFKPADADILVVYSSPWCPALKGLLETEVGLRERSGSERMYITTVNKKSNKFHASALDDAVERFGHGYDYLMAWETDVLALAPDWLDWFLAQMKPTDYAVGHWHHEKFVNPSCTLYRMKPILEMLAWCKEPQDPVLRWGEDFQNEAPLDNNIPRHMTDVIANMVSWIAGPFADKRGWSVGTKLKERPSGQDKGPGHYEPGQMLHHWAVQAGYTYTVCPTWTHEREPGLPLQTVYGVTEGPARGLEAGELLELPPRRNAETGAQEYLWRLPGAKTAHLWGGTRALDILKHPVECNFVRSNTPFWLAREARFWRDIVPADVQAQTLELIRQHGWHVTGCNGAPTTDRDREAAKFVQQCYLAGGVEC